MLAILFSKSKHLYLHLPNSATNNLVGQKPLSRLKSIFRHGENINQMNIFCGYFMCLLFYHGSKDKLSVASFSFLGIFLELTLHILIYPNK